MGDTHHQCRYCANCIFTINDTWWCDLLDKDINSPKRPNKCKGFLFQPISADDPNKTYKRRKPSPFVQAKLFEMTTDKQRKSK